jgi:hypothetical protein
LGFLIIRGPVILSTRKIIMKWNIFSNKQCCISFGKLSLGLFLHPPLSFCPAFCLCSVLFVCLNDYETIRYINFIKNLVYFLDFFLNTRSSSANIYKLVLLYCVPALVRQNYDMMTFCIILRLVLLYRRLKWVFNMALKIKI